MRLVLAAVVLFVLFISDVLVNSGGKLSLGLLTYIGFAVTFHLLVFEAVYKNSLLLMRIMWAIVVLLCIASFVSLDELFSGVIVSVFLIGYTMALMSFLKRQFSAHTHNC